MKERKYVMGNTAIARGALEAGVRVVAGYPGTPATEIVDECLGVPGVHVEWANNEKVAFELCTGASLCNVRAMPVMKHNGTNVVTDFLMHVNFTGIRGGMVLISADDPGRAVVPERGRHPDPGPPVRPSSHLRPELARRGQGHDQGRFRAFGEDGTGLLPPAGHPGLPRPGDHRIR